MQANRRSGIAGLLGMVSCVAMVTACGQAPADEVLGTEDVSTRTSQQGLVGTPAYVARYGPAVAYGNTRYFVVWSDIRTGGLYGSPVAQDGTMLKPGGVLLNPGDTSVRRVAIAFNGTHFFVVWETTDGVNGVRVTPDGTIVGPEFSAFNSPEAFGKVDIACSTEICLVTTTVEGDFETVVYFRRVTKDGVPLDSPAFTSVSAGFNYAREPAVAWDNTHKVFLVVWSDERGGGPGHEDIYGNRVTEAGSILDGDGFPISEAAGAQVTPDVVWTGRRFQVVWSDGRSGAADIYGALVRAGDARVDDPDGLPISTAPGVQAAPQLAHHNSKSLVVWDDARSGAHRIRGARWDEDGDVWDPSGFAISSGDQPAEFLPAVAYGANRFLTVYAAGAGTGLEVPHLVLGTRVTHDATVKDSPARLFTRQP